MQVAGPFSGTSPNQAVGNTGVRFRLACVRSIDGQVARDNSSNVDGGIEFVNAVTFCLARVFPMSERDNGLSGPIIPSVRAGHLWAETVQDLPMMLAPIFVLKRGYIDTGQCWQR